MDLNDLYKLAGIPRDDTPAIEPQPVEQPVAEQPMDGRDDMKAMIALVTPEQLNQLVGDTPVEEEGFANSGEEYAGEPEEYKGTLGSPADLSLRRYLGANGVPVNVDETKVYEDYKVEDITEAWKQFKAEPVAEHHQKDAEGNTIPHDDEVAEAVVDEDDVEEDNAFNSAAANAKKAGKKSFSFNGKTYPVKIDDKTADALTDSVEEEAEVVEDSADLDRLKKLAGAQQVDEAPFPGEYDYSDDKYDADGAVTGVGKQGYDMRMAKWSEDTPSELMMVIKKYNLDPMDAYQMATADVNADIDAIADLHDAYTDRMGIPAGPMDDDMSDLHDIDGGEKWLDSPEYDKVMTMVGDLCSAMGMEGAGREECGQALMKHVDENTPQESAEINDLRTLAGI